MSNAGNVTRAEMRNSVKFYGFNVRTRKQKKKKGGGKQDVDSCSDSAVSDICSSKSSDASIISSRHSDASSVESEKQSLQKRKYSAKSDSSQASDDSNNEMDSGSEDDPLVKKYGYLLGSFHEDKEDGALYQVSGVGTYDFEGKPYIVAYRKRFDSKKILNYA